MYRLDPILPLAQRSDLEISAVDGRVFIVIAAILLLIALSQFGKMLQPLREVLRALFAAMATAGLLVLILVVLVIAALSGLH